MKVLYKYAALLLTAVCVTKAEPPEGIYEAIYTVNYMYFQFDYLVYADSSDVYISALKLFNDLKIYNEYDVDLHALSGYISYPENKFKIDFKNFKGELRDSSFTIGDRDFFMEGGAIYINTRLLTNATGIAVKIHQSSLTYNITSRIDLPIAILNKRKTIERDPRLGMMNNEQFPLGYQSKGYLLNGLMVDWSLHSSMSQGVKRYGFGGSAGLQIIGGDLMMRGSGYMIDGGGKPIYEYSGRWRACFGENNWLTQITIGDLALSGVRAFAMGNKNLIGFQVSNESFQTPYFFSNKTIDGNAGPGWQVELLKNNQLIDHTVTDENGYYKFSAPVLYGVNRFELKYYGDKGEFMAKSLPLDVPIDQLRAGEIRYALNYGKMPTSELRLGEGRVSMGITNYITNTVYAAHSFEENSKPELINQLTILPFRNITARFIYNHNYYISGTFDFILGDAIMTQVSHQIFDVKSISGTALYMTNVNMFITRLFGSNVMGTLSGNRAVRRDGATSAINAGVSWYMHPFSYRIDYFTTVMEAKSKIRAGSHDISSELAYTWMDKPEWLRFLSVSQFGVRGYWDAMRGKLRNAYGYYTQGITNSASLNVTIGYDAMRKTMTGGLGLYMNLPYVRSSSGLEITSKGNTYNQSLSGSFGFDPNNWELVGESDGFGNSVGKGVANMRLFLDRNDNGIYDYEDYSIPNVNYKISSWSANIKIERHYARISNLNPYEKLYVQVDKNSIKNPNWMPKQETFSFVADPNIFKVIDIPCYTGGVIEGTVVYQVTPDSSYGQSGLILHLKNLYTEKEETLEVYSDGSFYKIGVAPGKYSLYVDEKQTRILTAISEPIEFEVKNALDGDYVTGLVLKLTPTDKAPGLELPRESTLK